jgi:hypothetical protein
VAPEAVHHVHDKHQQMAGGKPRPAPYTNGALGWEEALWWQVAGSTNPRCGTDSRTSAHAEHQQMAGGEPRPSPYTDGRLSCKEAL